MASTQGSGRLFETKLRREYIEGAAHQGLPIAVPRATHEIRSWLDDLRAGGGTEAPLEQQFNERILGRVLGYTIYPSRGATAWAKPGTEHTGCTRQPDVMLGDFADHEQLVWTAAVELKSPGADFDSPHAGSRPGETPVQQVFDYARGILGVRWALVTDMERFRLYSVEDDTAHEAFELRECASGPRASKEVERLLAFLHHSRLVAGHRDAPVHNLYTKAQTRQLEIRSQFYDTYYEIRGDLFAAVTEAAKALDDPPGTEGLLQATQRLLDRMLFLYYCEDHPSRLIDAGTVRRVTEAAANLPGGDAQRVYRALKELFREVDEGSPPASGVSVAAYNGELFKPHPVVDKIDLPDELHRRTYRVEMPEGDIRRVKGVWGLDVFDFWQELNEHLLGHIFEESLSDLHTHATQGDLPSRTERLAARKRGGVFYTASLLAEHVAQKTARDWLARTVPVDDDPANLDATLEVRLQALERVRAADLACGSGAFLVSLYRTLASAVDELHTGLTGMGQLTLDRASVAAARTQLLQSAIHGMDLLPQAVELAKLSLWLRSARKNQKVPDLGGNIVPGNTLDLPTSLVRLGGGPGCFDIIVGNPPWGADLDQGDIANTATHLGLDPEHAWDSWELFVALSIHALAPDGHLGLVLPDSLLYPDKAAIRRHIFDSLHVTDVANVGPEWFGPNVRMGTCLLFAHKPATVNDPAPYDLSGTLLAGPLRRETIRGETLLAQATAQRTRAIPYHRVLADEDRRIEVFRGRVDDRILEAMEGASTPLGDLCDSGRGIELNRDGITWRCPSCQTLTTPGAKSKGTYKATVCDACGHNIDAESATEVRITSEVAQPGTVPWLTGTDIAFRYRSPEPTAYFDTTVTTDFAKDPERHFAPDKILIRQAGVGIAAHYDLAGAYYAQSIYFFRLHQQQKRAGYDHRYLLGALLSRTMNYYTFKRFGEVDVAKAFAKKTLGQYRRLPIPTVDFSDSEARQTHDAIVDNVDEMLAGADVGSKADHRIELSLRRLWGITTEGGAYINGQFRDLEGIGRIGEQLFPHGAPTPPVLGPAAS